MIRGVAGDQHSIIMPNCAPIRATIAAAPATIRSINSATGGASSISPITCPAQTKPSSKSPSCAPRRLTFPSISGSNSSMLVAPASAARIFRAPGESSTRPGLPTLRSITTVARSSARISASL